MKYKLLIIPVALMIMLASCGNMEESSIIEESVITTEQSAATTIDAYSLNDEEASSVIEQIYEYSAESTATTTAKAEFGDYPSYVMYNGYKLDISDYSDSDKQYVFDNYGEFIEKLAEQYPEYDEPYRNDMKFVYVNGFEPQIVYYQNGIYITVDDVDLKFDNDGNCIYIFDLTIENKTESNLNFYSKSLAVNDYMFDCSINESIAPGKKTSASFKLNEKDYVGKIDNSASFNIELYFDAIDMSTYQKVVSLESAQFSFEG